MNEKCNLKPIMLNAGKKGKKRREKKRNIPEKFVYVEVYKKNYNVVEGLIRCGFQKCNVAAAALPRALVRPRISGRHEALWATHEAAADRG